MDAKYFSKRKIVLLLSSTLGLWACGRSGGGSGDVGASGTERSTLVGSIKSIAGSQSEMNQWAIAMVERDTGLSYVSDINALGNYKIEGVDLNEAHTLVLLDPQYRFAAVLSYTGKDEGTVRQYFRTDKTQLPTLVHNGPVINFTDVNDLAWELDAALDEDGDLIPNGSDPSLRLASAVDTDEDKIPNEADGDIDGDGIPNWFDADDDGDGELDCFDGDSNGDEVSDLAQTAGDLYFFNKIQYLAVQVIQDVQNDGSLATSLAITTRVLDSNKPTAIKVRGPEALFADAESVRFDPDTGEPQREVWDGTLLDDGRNEDGGVGDLMYSRRIPLRTGAAPKSNQVVFLQHVSGQGAATSLTEFPFTFPSMVTGAVGGTFDPASQRVTLSGQPFGTESSFRWSVHVFDAASIKVFASEPIEGAEISYIFPEGVIEPGKSYTARIVATAIDRIPSFPSWIIRSKAFSL